MSNVRWTIKRTVLAPGSTPGVLFDANGAHFCVTLERPWLGNQPDVSCIPAGIYVAQRFHSPKRGYDVFKLVGVDGRTMIEIHIGNFESNTDGCILVGQSAETIDSIDDSKVAFDRFMAANADVNSFQIAIENPS